MYTNLSMNGSFYTIIYPSLLQKLSVPFFASINHGRYVDMCLINIYWLPTMCYAPY